MKQPILTISLGLVLLFPSLYMLVAKDNDAQHNVQLAREIATDLGKSDIVAEIRRNADLSFTPMLDIEKVKMIVLRDLDKAKHLGVTDPKGWTGPSTVTTYGVETIPSYSLDTRYKGASNPSPVVGVK